MSESISGAVPSLPALELGNRTWQRWLSAAISVTLMVTILWKLSAFGYRSAFNTLPAKPLFWLALATYYFSLPVADWLIFRRLWKLPAGGFAALLRKLISNEILFGYSGEAWFYTWARQHARLVTAPFGAIKDVSVLSALAGNLMTLTMLGAAWPLLGTLGPQFHGRAVFGSGVFIVASSMIIFIFKNRIFSLPRAQLQGIFAVHVARLITTTLLSGIMWHIALPQISLVWLVLLATFQLLVTRLPLVPNKDLMFASLAILLIGHDGAVAALIAMIATCLLATHLVLGALLILPDMFKADEA